MSRYSILDLGFFLMDVMRDRAPSMVIGFRNSCGERGGTERGRGGDGRGWLRARLPFLSLESQSLSRPDLSVSTVSPPVFLSCVPSAHPPGELLLKLGSEAGSSEGQGRTSAWESVLQAQHGREQGPGRPTEMKGDPEALWGARESMGQTEVGEAHRPERPGFEQQVATEGSQQQESRWVRVGG